MSEDTSTSEPKYEAFFDSDPSDPIQIFGWYPIPTEKIKNPEKIDEYIEQGLLREIDKANAQEEAGREKSDLMRMVSWYKADGIFWFRIAGIGFSIVNKEKHRPLFSERHGHRNVLRIGKWGIEWLPKI